MKRTELQQELQGLADSLDDSVTPQMAVITILDLVSNIVQETALTVFADEDGPKDPSEAYGDFHSHIPVQHRDGRPPWCNECGLTKDYTVPASRFVGGHNTPKGP